MEAQQKNIIVLFGATGDLSRRYLLPALEVISQDHSIEVVLVGRRDWGKEDLVNFFNEVGDEFGVKNFHIDLYTYLRVDLLKSEDYKVIADYFEKKDLSFTNVIYYLSLGPDFFVPVVKNLAYYGLHQSTQGGDRRVVIEKPFGKDLKTATRLNLDIQDVFSESQIYRIDHYLGKNAIVDLLEYRLKQGSNWGHFQVKKITVLANETLTVLSRGEYYDANGAIRDYVQNHLLQILAIIAMREPYTHDSDDIRDKKMQLLQSISPLLVDPRHGILLGQYEGYREEEGVDPNSRTETFIKVELHSDDPYWKGVPFVLQSGKALDVKETKVIIDFVDGTQKVFAETPENKNNAYEILIDAIMRGDQTFFVRWDSIKAAWQIVDDLIHCKDNCPVVYTYPRGSSGPMGGQKLHPTEAKVRRSGVDKLKEREELQSYAQITEKFLIAIEALKTNTVYIGLPGGTSLDHWYAHFLQSLSRDTDLFERVRILFAHVKWCFVDERIVELDHRDSNYKHVYEVFLGKLIERNLTKKENIIPIDPSHAFPAAQYSMSVPKMDIALFGVGGDGHIASLFPRDKNNEYHLDSTDKDFIFVDKNSKDHHKRITMSPYMIRNLDTAFVFFIGETKKQAFHYFLDPDVPVDQCPAKLLYDVHRLCSYQSE